MSTSTLRSKSFYFAVRIVRLVQRLQKGHKEYVLSGQLLRCGTSGGAQFREAEYAQSKRDFINKMSIGLKEVNETDYFLRLLQATDYIDQSEFKSFISECGELKAMSITSIRTAKKNLAAEIAAKVIIGFFIFSFLFSLFT